MEPITAGMGASLDYLIREHERTRIARDLHDELGQRLMVLRLKLDQASRILKRGAKAKAAEMLDTSSQDLGSIMEVVRRISTNLRGTNLNPPELKKTINLQLREFTNLTGIKCEWSGIRAISALNPEQSAALLVVLQQTMTNVAQHAHATRIGITFELSRGKFKMTLHDNGVGIPAKSIAAADSLGIIGMRERVSTLNGKLQIRRIRAGGTLIILTLPVGQR